MTHDELKTAHAAGAWIYGIEDDGKLHRIEDPQWTCPADRYVALVPYIAELGQEVGAVAEDDAVGMASDLPGSNGGFTHCVFNASDVPRGSLLFTSPAHTSEARDYESTAALADVFMASFNCEAESNTHSRLYEDDHHNVVNALCSVFAAMRQEGE